MGISRSNLVVCDLDGVLVDLVGEAALAVAKELKEIVPLGLATDFDPARSALARSCGSKVARAFEERFYSSTVQRNARPHWDMLYALRAWGGEVVFLTARAGRETEDSARLKSVRDATRDWLWEWGFPHPSVYHSDQKGETLMKIVEEAKREFDGVRVFEDATHNLREMIEVCEDGSVSFFMPTRPWNHALARRRDGIDGHPRLRIYRDEELPMIFGVY